MAQPPALMGRHAPSQVRQGHSEVSTQTKQGGQRASSRFLFFIYLFFFNNKGTPLEPSQSAVTGGIYHLSTQSQLLNSSLGSKLPT